MYIPMLLLHCMMCTHIYMYIASRHKFEYTYAHIYTYVYIHTDQDIHIDVYIYIYATSPPPKDLPKSMPSETFLATFIPTVQIMMTQTGGGHVKTCAYPGFTQMFQTGQ